MPTLYRAVSFKMGCCESSRNKIVPLSPFTNQLRTSLPLPLLPEQRKILQGVLDGMPVHCRQAIIDIPPQQFFKIYDFYVMAIYYLHRQEYEIVTLYEREAIIRMF